MGSPKILARALAYSSSRSCLDLGVAAGVGAEDGVMGPARLRMRIVGSKEGIVGPGSRAAGERGTSLDDSRLQGVSKHQNDIDTGRAWLWYQMRCQ